ncbi:MAG TPA: response regulator transcription factor [Caldilineaceae bacterium]|nr:response regulator transcription factor [Caldilineaceae bacterium]
MIEGFSSLWVITPAWSVNVGITVITKPRKSIEGALAASPQLFKRILVVDDEAELRRLLARKLSAAGYEVVEAESALCALALLQRIGLPHLAIIDINMPGMSGLEFCEIVQQYADLPVIMVTAVTEATTTVAAIEKYAEDYVTKPFNLDELVARVQRLLRRISDYSYAVGAVVTIDRHLKLSFVRKQVLVEETVVDLTPIETKLLYILWRHAGHVIENEFLINRIWPDQEVYDNTLRVPIHRLSQKLTGNKGRKGYIVTERGRGYRFVTTNEEGQ